MHLPYPVTRQINEIEFELMEDYIVVLPNLKILYIKKGFIFDGASIPKLFWSIIGSPFGKYTASALIHDALYASELLPREDADTIFINTMVYKGVNEDKRNAMYLAVDIFGKYVWINHTDESITEARTFVSIES